MPQNSKHRSVLLFGLSFVTVCTLCPFFILYDDNKQIGHGDTTSHSSSFARDTRLEIYIFLSACLSMHQIRRTSPSSVARVLRTRTSTRIMATKGTNPATIMIGSKECAPAAWRASEKWPIKRNAMIVPIPAPVPLMPLTEATDSLLKRSEGKTLAMVENEA